MLSVTYKPFMLSVTYKPFMLNVTYKPFMLSVVLLNVIMLSVVMRSVMVSEHGELSSTFRKFWSHLNKKSEYIYSKMFGGTIF